MIRRTYNEWLAQLARGRGGRKRAGRDAWLTKRGDGTLVFSLEYYNYSGEFLTLTPDNVYTLTFPEDGQYTNTLYNRIHEIAGLYVGSDALGYGNHKQRIRVRLRPANDTKQYWWKWPSIPYTKGLRAKDGMVLNPEIAVDYVRKLNHGRALEHKRAYRKLHALLRVAARIGAVEKVSRWDIYKDGRTFADVNLHDPTMEDAQVVFNHGNVRWYRWRTENDEAEKLEAFKRQCESGLRKFREWLHETNNSYDWVEVPKEELKEAA